MQQVFAAGNLLALAGWLALLAAPLVPRARPAIWRLTGLALPSLFAATYIWLLVANWNGEGGFGSLEEVQALFAVPGLLVAGWLHYLAFDLFVGTWIARDGARRGLPHLALIPCLALTFLAGPAGLLLYLALRGGFARPAAGTAAVTEG